MQTLEIQIKLYQTFLTNFRDEFLKTIPENLAIGLDKRNLIKNIKSMYQLKGTQKGHDLFLEYYLIKYQKHFILEANAFRVSDGQFDTQKVLRSFV